MGSGTSDSPQAAVLLSRTTATKWLYQNVRVEPSRWYEAGARLLPLAGVELARVRIAWYGPADGSGSQLETADSEPVLGASATLVAVTTGPVEAPASAFSAQLRIMLRPLGGGPATLVADDAFFAGVATPTPTPSPSPTASPPASAPALTAPAAPPPAAGAATTATPARPGAEAGAPTIGAAPLALRITELLPDPVQPGPDAAFEWVEVTNVGRTAIELAGFELRDNDGRIALPDLSLPAGRSIVVAGSEAEIGDALAVRVAAGLFNGLANGGDRLALLAGDGRRADALSYGSDASHDAPPLSAPGPGRSLRRHFAADGTLLAVEIAAEPSPGRVEPPGAGHASAQLGAGSGGAAAEASPASEADRDSTAPLDAPAPLRFDDGGGTNRAAWIALIALALGALGGVAALRVRELLREV